MDVGLLPGVEPAVVSGTDEGGWEGENPSITDWPRGENHRGQRSAPETDGPTS